MQDFRLHHIGYLVDDLRKGVEYYVRTLGYRLESEPIADKGQTATVQFLRHPDEDHWLELITPLGPGSKLSGALQRRAALHHLCYEVPCIASAFGELRRGGSMPLGRPTSGAAYDGRLIAWAADPLGGLTELVEAGPGARCLATERRRVEPA